MLCICIAFEAEVHISSTVTLHTKQKKNMLLIRHYICVHLDSCQMNYYTFSANMAAVIVPMS